ncbi:MAG: hypothetical protein ACRCRP_02355 [Metamycoplasmataceae bacterium]
MNDYQRKEFLKENEKCFDSFNKISLLLSLFKFLLSKIRNLQTKKIHKNMKL